MGGAGLGGSLLTLTWSLHYYLVTHTFGLVLEVRNVGHNRWQVYMADTRPRLQWRILEDSLWSVKEAAQRHLVSRLVEILLEEPGFGEQ